jgi:hypothetical protein
MHKRPSLTPYMTRLRFLGALQSIGCVGVKVTNEALAVFGFVFFTILSGETRAKHFDFFLILPAEILQNAAARLSTSKPNRFFVS